MRLSRLSASGIHGRLDFSEQLDPVAVVIGPNGAGKTTLAGLARLVLNGPSGATYPVLGTSPAYDWEASVAFDRGPQVGRWMRGGTHAASFNGIGRKLKEVQSRIDSTLGRAATWNLEAFLADTPSKRQAFLEAEVLQGAGWLAERVWSELDAAGAPRAALEEVLTGGVVDPPHGDGRVLLTSVLVALRDAASAADGEARRLLPVVKNDELEEKKGGGPAGTVAGWRGKVAELDERIAGARERRGEVAGRQAAREDLARQLQQAECDLEAHLNTDWSGKVAAQRERADDAAVACDAALRAGEEARGVHERAVTTKTEAQRAYEETVRTAADARARIPARTMPGELPMDWDGFDLGERPVVVVHRATGHLRTDTVWRDGHRLGFGDDPDGSSYNPTEYALFDIGSLTAIAPAIEQSLAAAEAPVLDLSPLAEAARLAEQEREAAKVRLDAAVRAEKSAGDKLQAARADYAAKKSAAETAEKVLGTVRGELDTAAAREADLRARIERLATQVGESLDGQVQAIDVEIESLRAERDAAQKNADALSDAAGAIAKRTENREALQAAQAARTRARELASIVEATLSRMLGELVSPLEEPVSRITRAVLGADLRVELDGGATFWLVWPDHKAPLAASRSEQAVAMMALRCAVQQHLNGWRHLVLDDMENLAGARRTRFVEAMLDEVRDGRLDNFIGACVEDGWSPPAGAQTIRRSL